MQQTLNKSVQRKAASVGLETVGVEGQHHARQQALAPFERTAGATFLVGAAVSEENLAQVLVDRRASRLLFLE